MWLTPFCSGKDIYYLDLFIILCIKHGKNKSGSGNEYKMVSCLSAAVHRCLKVQSLMSAGLWYLASLNLCTHIPFAALMAAAS